jgi:hypothetical protein
MTPMPQTSSDRLDRGLPSAEIQDTSARIGEGEKLATARQRDWIVKLACPALIANAASL